jgi:rRNA maturation endonuclease Nob1
MRIRLIFSIAFAVFISSSAFVWNSLGHKVVAEIAWQQLEPAQCQSIVDMAQLQKCKDCGGQVSTNAKACPHCGSKAFNRVNQIRTL